MNYSASLPLKKLKLSIIAPKCRIENQLIIYICVFFHTHILPFIVFELILVEKIAYIG